MNTKKSAVKSAKDDKLVSIKETTPKANGVSTQKPSIEDIQKLLDKQIENFENKTKLIRHRAKFLATKEQLSEFVQKQGADYDEFLEDSDKQIVFKDTMRYGLSEGIAITNNYLVREFAQFLISKIDQKLIEIEKEIIS